jgi:hypothetical protein
VAPLLFGQAVEERPIFSHWNGKVSVRTEQYRLDDGGRLFDMKADPGQRRDLAKERPEVAAKLGQAIAAWRRDVLGELKRDAADDRPLKVGYREFPVTQLPARDGVASGGIARSASAPNCSYFTGWTSVDDSISWDIEVHTPGKYEATVWYTCAAADLGSQIELALGDRRARATVAKAHDPPAVGAEHDRVPRRGESYVKEFAPLSLGTLELTSGRGSLVLRALSKPGKQVMEVRGVTLRLVP